MLINKKVFLIYIGSVLTLCFSILLWKSYISNDNNQIIEQEIVVISKNKNYYFVQFNNKRYLLYKNNYDFEVGQKLTSTFTITEFNPQSKNFWYSKFILGLIKLNNYHKNDIKLSWIDKFFNLNFFTKDSYKNMTLTLLFGKVDYDSNILDISKNLGIVHLIVISGFHFNIVFRIFNKLFSKLKFNLNIYFPLMFISVYFIFVNFSVSSLRAYLYIILVNLISLIKINNTSKYNFINEKLFIIYITLLISLLINPFFIFNISLWYSYLITILIIVFKRKSVTKKQIILNQVYIFINSYLFSLLISLTTQNNFNILAIINIFIFSIVIEFSIIFNLLFWFIPIIIDYYYIIFNLIFDFCNIINITLTTNFLLNQDLVLAFIFSIIFIKIIFNNIWTNQPYKLIIKQKFFKMN